MNSPNFFIIGVVKGGTTSLYNYLQQHSDVYFSPIKETNFFSRFDIDESKLIKEYASDIKINLKKYFANGMKEVVHIAHIKNIKDYNSLFSQVNNEKVIGEISNSYTICPQAVEEINKFNPNAKLLIMLRNPISRIWSQYLMNLREGKTLEKDFIKEIEKDYKKKDKGWGVNHQYLELGLYYEQIRKVLKYFPKEQFKIMFFEDYVNNSESVIHEICNYLEIDPNQNIDFKDRHNAASLPRSKAVNVFLVKTGLLKQLKNLFGREMRQKLKGLLYSTNNIPKIKAEQRKYLIDFYQKDVENLSSLLNVDLIKKWSFYE